MPRGIVRLLGLVIVLAMVIAACGDSGGDATATTGEASGTTVDGNGDNGGGSNTLGTIGTIGDIPGISGDCEALAEVILGFSQVLLGVTGDYDRIIAAAAAELPSDLADDIAVIRAALGDYVDVLDDLDINLTLDPTAFADLTPEQQQQFAEATEALDAADVQTAFDALEAHAEKECVGIGFGN